MDQPQRKPSGLSDYPSYAKGMAVEVAAIVVISGAAYLIIGAIVRWW